MVEPVAAGAVEVHDARGDVRRPSEPAPVVPPESAPGHLLRRAQQVHTELWGARVDGLTGPQYATLVAVAGWDDVDQRRAGQLASLDKSTVADVVRRLADKGWVDRIRDPHDGRRRLLTLTDGSAERLAEVTEAARSVQRDILGPLPASDRQEFTERLGRVARIEEADVAGQRHEDGVLLMRAAPGYLIRRAQQVHTTLWSATVPDVTGPQYAVLAALARLGTADQSRIGEAASLDSSSTADIVARLGAQGWVAKETSAEDRRRARVRLTAPARSALRSLTGPVEAVQSALLGPLGPEERAVFIGHLHEVACTGRRP
ncbi:MarR family winged helix-turn-helix transcriptional regulator [Streptomyces phaeolivaceus]|uniref:MarR family winged helix-turn-helix transcriptional regulator n=1 Tax=Streptomyces phaeolivaceus TaxID=2653200 RepID=UPI001869AB80|nr:MarR family transcriptional regulator [Streptomyces phaeolivaceus]